MKKVLFFLTFLGTICCHITGNCAAYTYPDLSEEVLQAVEPYLMREGHPAKKILDKIFTKKRATLNSQTVSSAGFYPSKKRVYSHLIVCRHLKLPNYYLKFYTDDTPGDSFLMCLSRIQGAAAIRDNIRAHGYEKYFKVPKKWIYLLPCFKDSECERQHPFLLVAENMNIRHKSDNLKKWKKSMTADRLDAIYVMLQESGLQDSIWPFNLPYSTDGKNAFIDTEIHHRWPVYFELLLKYLSPPMEQHWRILVGNGGPIF